MENKFVDNKSKLIDNIFFAFAMFMFAFVPISVNGQIPDSKSVLVRTIINAAFVVLFLIRNKINLKQLIIVTMIFAYLIIFTIAWEASSPNFKFAPDYFGMTLIFFVMCITKINMNLNKKFVNLIFNITNTLIILWGLLIILNNQNIITFTSRFYSQYYTNAVLFTLLQRSPVTSFGVGSIASFYYFIIFLLNFLTIKERINSFINYVFCFSFIFLTICTFKNSSIVFSVLMIAFMFFANNNKYYRILYLLFVVIGVAICSSFLYQKYLLITGSNINGINGRFLSDLYKNDIKAINEYFAVGFNQIVDAENKLYLTDCGYIIFMLIGNIPLVFSAYYLLYSFLRDNIKEIHSIILLLSVMLYEIGYTIIMDYRFCYCFIMAILYINTLYQKSKSQDIVISN